MEGRLKCTTITFGLLLQLIIVIFLYKVLVPRAWSTYSETEPPIQIDSNSEDVTSIKIYDDVIRCGPNEPKRINREMPKEVVITTWFKVNEDSPFAKKLKEGAAQGKELAYLNTWYTSVNKLGLNGIILVNGWMNDTVKRMFTTPKIQIVEMDINSCCPKRPCSLTLLDWRWLVYNRAVPYFGSEYTILSDGRDVSFRKNPFPFMKSLSQRYDLFFGSEYMPLSELGEISRPYKECYHGYIDGSGPFAYNAGVVAGKLGALAFLLGLLEKEVKRLEKEESGATDCDMATMNHVMHSQFIPQSNYSIYTGLPFIKDPQLQRYFKSNQPPYNPAMVSLDITDDRWKTNEYRKSSQMEINVSIKDQCANCTRTLHSIDMDKAIRSVWRSPKWFPPPHCLMLTYVEPSWEWRVELPPKWGPIVIFHEGNMEQWKDRFINSSVQLIKVDRDAICKGCSSDEAKMALFYAYLLPFAEKRPPLMYTTIIDRLTSLHRKDSPCDFVKNSRHYKFLWHIHLFVGGQTLPLHYTPTLQKAYKDCYGSNVDGVTAFVYDPVFMGGFTQNVINVLHTTACELACNITMKWNVGNTMSSVCLWPAFNHAVHIEKIDAKVWSRGFPIYNNQPHWKWQEGFRVEQKFGEGGPFPPEL
eukprot:NODE_1335_length_2006_cov_66.222517_g1129_i0.p1 GENE.NODE_1335_length_2006_cov_66.222517_g1129_i0~~NODE_1335_length_2006_cov_66.222517_g1129_i0.p1  ORF type:complete len:642 (+),score=114.16 NODE_1335_length_2006_cov_66.222517_g1129_i0:24-1949(+)